jgi:pyruvate,water dikinase
MRAIIMKSTFPADFEDEIRTGYRELSKVCGKKYLVVAVRSSATAEDLPNASFAGQQETYLNITGEKALLDACKRCFASLFTNRAIAYRSENKIDHFRTYLSVGVQKMIRSDLGSAGVMFTLDTETGFPNLVLISGSYGLGESVVKGTVNPENLMSLSQP